MGSHPGPMEGIVYGWAPPRAQLGRRRAMDSAPPRSSPWVPAFIFIYCIHLKIYLSGGKDLSIYSRQSFMASNAATPVPAGRG